MLPVPRPKCTQPLVAMRALLKVCPYQGKIGKEAKAEWAANASKRPDVKDAEKEYIAKCTHEVNPNRDKINRDVVGLVKKTYTRKTKTSKQCKKEFYATQ